MRVGVPKEIKENEFRIGLETRGKSCPRCRRHPRIGRRTPDMVGSTLTGFDRVLLADIGGTNARFALLNRRRDRPDFAYQGGGAAGIH